MIDFAPSAKLRELGERIAKERADVAAIFEAAKRDDGYDLPAEKVAELRKRNDELDKLAKEYNDLLAVERMAHENRVALDAYRSGPRPPAPAPAKAEPRPFRAILAEKAADLKALADGNRGSVRIDLSGTEWKTLLTSADIAPAADRLDRIVPSAQYLGDVTPLFVPGSTSSDTVEFYEETTFTNAAAETAEGSAAAEAALDFTLRTFPTQEISTFIPVTRRVLSDLAQVESYVRGRLVHMLALRRSQQLIQGNGTSPNIRGILNTSGIQTQAKGSDPVFDAIHKAMTLVRVTGDAEPTAVILHPNDWQDIRLSRTIDGIYILGNPADSAPARLWGLDVAVSSSITENTGLVGAFGTFAQVFEREGVTLEASTEHSTFFTERKVALLVYQRLALAVYRPAAFCQVTGI